ncbi:MAG: nucleoside triphosphate pyrophosphohydrolase [Spirochaetaceae bacterium]|jgi:tetrapyrrole methylase family protein/MazG family protein|nr:nucleoside triphosphate pyrophosphohydrolase [Spirochaetaceae bacterium]
MESFDKLLDIIKTLRGPGGCPWDIKQTHRSLKPYVIEEAYEVADAIEQGDPLKLADELGDVILQVVLHAQIGSETQSFDIETVLKCINEKMVRRHPHVFGDETVSGTKEVLQNWEEIKKKENQGQNKADSVMDQVPLSFPALYRASKIQKKAARLGFDWPDSQGPWDKIREEIEEFDFELKQGSDREKIIEEFGDILFSLVNLSRKLDMDAEDALQLATKKFENRFRHVEKRVEEEQRPMKDYSLEELDVFWDEAKKT